MKPPILIVRTVSIEKLAPVVATCAERWPDHPLWVVSNPGRSAELRGDPRIAAVIPYEMGPAGFAEPINCALSLEAVVVPVANRDGSGYANVLRACRYLHARRRFIAPFARELRELSASGWHARWLGEFALQQCAARLARLWGAWLRLRFRSLTSPRR